MKKIKLYNKKKLVLISIISFMSMLLIPSVVDTVHGEAEPPPSFEVTFIVKNTDGESISNAVIGMNVKVTEYSNEWNPLTEIKYLLFNNKWYHAMHIYETNSQGETHFEYSIPDQYMFFVKKEGYKSVLGTFNANENDNKIINVELVETYSQEDSGYSTDNSLPGFELLTLLSAFFVTISLLRYKRNY